MTPSKDDTRVDIQMVSYDSTYIALFLTTVVAMAALGLALTLGALTRAVVHH